MSTALVSGFCDFGDVIHQNRKNVLSAATVRQQVTSLVGSGERRSILGSGSSSSQNMLQQTMQQPPAASSSGGITSAYLHSALSQQISSVAAAVAVQQQQQLHYQQQQQASAAAVVSMTPPERYSPTMAAMLLQGGGSPVLGGRDYTPATSIAGYCSQPGTPKKFERSMSEPVIERSMMMRERNGSGSSGGSLSRDAGSSVNSSRYKTELCRPFEESGHCKYGDKCQFAHGGLELRSLSRHPKYKTELCRTFHTIGFCPYGPRCHFVHNEDLAKLAQLGQMREAGTSPPPLSPQQTAMMMQQQAAITSQLLQHQMSVPTSAMCTGRTSSIPTPIRSRSFNVDLSLALHDSLGSTADSPPSSITDSPTMSPTFLAADDFASMSAFSPPQSAPAMQQSSFTFPGEDLAGLLCNPPPPQNHISQSSAGFLGPLNIQTTPAQLACLVEQLHALDFTQNTATDLNNNDADFQSFEVPQMFMAPPSPPDSLSGESSASSSSMSMASNTCTSPLDVSRGLRLPIFSQLSAPAAD